MKIVGVILPIKASARKETKKGNKKTVELNYLPLKAYKIMATNLEVGKYKNIKERTCVAPSLNFMFVPSNRNKHAVAKCCAQLGRVPGWGVL